MEHDGYTKRDMERLLRSVAATARQAGGVFKLDPAKIAAFRTRAPVIDVEPDNA